ncbi:MAG TPA: CDP-glucose 4,6-dehydratase [Candidatus Sulfotelmatobacter sp.]|nr:CDP-glucose 4,6-dehydratase [Candidatus Sulfotelmatobacter sp.]
MSFWRKKKILLTGQTGFKGAWLCLWLAQLGAEVTGCSLEPPTEPNLFELARVGKLVDSRRGDVRDLPYFQRVMKEVRPEIIFHLAAQPIVRESYKVPVETFDTNVMGTVNVLEAARQCPSVKAIVNVTTDKVYENRVKGQGSRVKGYEENAPLGGYDPYSSSKACSELVAQAYRRSYGLNIATARAGNVIGGGDWAADRLVPDFVRSILKGQDLIIRNPKAVRPWQHVLEPLAGYLLLAENLYRHPGKYASAWNFGPRRKDAKSVEWLAKKLCALWGEKADYAIDKGEHPHEAGLLILDAGKTRRELGWRPKWGIETAIAKIVDWTKAYRSGQDLRAVCYRQIEEYSS